MKKTMVLNHFLCFALTAFLIGNCSTLFAKTIKVGVLFDGPSDTSLEFLESINKELPNTLLDGDYVVFPEESKIKGNFDISVTQSGLNKLMNDPKVDAILAIGPVASHMTASCENLKKPVVASHIFNAELQKLSEKNNTSNKKNLCFVDFDLDIGQHIKKFQEIKSFKKLHLLISPHMLKGIPQLADSLKAQTKKTGVELEIVSAKTKPYDLSMQLKNAEAVYVAPLPDLPEEQRCMILARVNELKIPTMSMFGKDMLQCGVLFTITAGFDTLKLARRVAGNLAGILYGEELSTFPTAFSPIHRMTINMATARAIGVFPTFSQMTDAILVNEEEISERKLSMTQAIETALSKNLSIIAKGQEIKAGTHSIDRARAALVPRGNVYIRQVEIDPDRAESMLTPAEQSTQIGTNLRYTIISEDAKAAVDVQKYFLAAKKDEERALMLDIIQDAAVSYLNVLKAKTLQNIQLDNLEVTRANLELAKQREKVGTAAPAEVYRWEIQMATAKQSVVEAMALRKKAELALNEVLAANQEESFNTVESDIFADVFFLDYNRVAPYIDNVNSYKGFKDFLVMDSYVFSPELSAIGKNIDAAGRMYRAHLRRGQMRPTLDISGNFTRTISKHGEGDVKPTINDVNLPLSKLHPGVPGIRDVNMPLSSLFKFPDDNDWAVQMSLTFPVFDGGNTQAAIKESDRNLDMLKTKRDYLKQKLELKTRASLEDAKASFLTIKLAKTRADSAEKALEVVRNAYSRGAITILDLIDAQNAHRIAKEASANAVFTFLTDFVKVCRSVGTFDFILNQQTNEEWYKRLEEYFEVNGIATASRKQK